MAKPKLRGGKVKKISTLAPKIANIKGSTRKDGSIVNPYQAKRNVKVDAVGSSKAKLSVNSPLNRPTDAVGSTKTKIDINNPNNPDVKFPEKTEGLQVLKENIGGSNGARIVKDGETNNKFVEKKVAATNPQKKGQMKEENLADSIYEFFGVDVPKSKVYNNKDGSVSKLSEHIEGQDLYEMSVDDIKARPDIVKNLRKGFAVDALTANWDVMGLANDNIKVTADNRAFRIDNGGALRYRAQGALKGEAFNNDAGELWSLRKLDNLQGLNGGAGRNAQRFFNDMPYRQVMSQVDNIVKNKEGLMRHLINKGANTETINKLNKRIDAFKSYRDKYVRDKASGKDDATIDKETEAMVWKNRENN